MSSEMLVVLRCWTCGQKAAGSQAEAAILAHIASEHPEGPGPPPGRI